MTGLPSLSPTVVSCQPSKSPVKRLYAWVTSFIMCFADYSYQGNSEQVVIPALAGMTDLELFRASLVTNATSDTGACLVMLRHFETHRNQSPLIAAPCLAVQ
jgi:hypothetical protein